MKIRLVVLMSFCVIFGACERRAPDTTEAAGESVRSHGAERDYFAESMDAKLDAIEDDIDRLERYAAEMKGTAKPEFERSIESLRAQKDVVDQRLDDLRKAGDDSWTGLKPGVKSAFQELEASLKDLSAKYTPLGG